MTKRADVPDFSRVVGSPDDVLLVRTEVGQVVERCIVNLPALCDCLRILQYVVMPDHVHFLVFATQYLPRSLGAYIGMLKVRIGQLLRDSFGVPKPVFDNDFYDRILRPSHNLHTIYEYIRQNPFRLAVRRANPDYFTRRNDMEFDGRRWQAYGNMQLLENPFKEQVVIHRADSRAERADNLERWMHTAANGGVLVSPFISADEKNVRISAERSGGKIILLSNEPLRDREHPGDHNFQLCSCGRLLIIAPEEAMQAGRATFLYLNGIASKIAAAR